MVAFKACVLTIFLVSSVGHAEYFAAPALSADWQMKKSASFCQLKQEIPLYGMADFSHQSGQPLRFSIREKRFKPAIIKASLTVDSAPWMHGSSRMEDYLVNLETDIDIQNYPRLSVYGDAAETMLDALSKGMSPTFTYVRANNRGELPHTNVAISAVNFAKKYEQFKKCRRNFLPFGLKDDLEKSLFFMARSQKINADVFTKLKHTAKYIKQVKGSKVAIVSDTAVTGNSDKHWFLKRAKTISIQLQKLGVSKSKVLIKSGETSRSKDSQIVNLSVFGPDSIRAIYYKKGNTRLSTNEKRRLDLLVSYRNEFLPDKQFVIKSHTDSKGKKARNLTVSRKRGNVIKQYLLSQGIDEKDVRVKAYGESKPAKSNRFPRGRAQNRRAIIEFFG